VATVLVLVVATTVVDVAFVVFGQWL